MTKPTAIAPFLVTTEEAERLCGKPFFSTMGHYGPNHAKQHQHQHDNQT